MINFFKKYKDLIFVFGLYLLLALIFTWPIILNLKTVIYGGAGDPFYNLWVFHNLRFGDLIVNAPSGLGDFSHIIQPNQPVIDFISRSLTYLFGDIAAYNLMIIFPFPLAGLAIFLLVKLLTKNVWAAFFAGLIFAFSPYHLAQSQVHISLVSIYWLAFFTYFLIKLWKESHWKYAVLAGLFFSLTLMDNYQYGYMATLVLLLFSIFIFGQKLLQDRKELWQTLKLLMIIIATGLLVLFIFDNKIFFALVKKDGLFSLGPARDFRELAVYSAQKFNYLLPSPENPIFGQFTKDIYEKSIKETGSNLTEQTLYLGFTPLIIIVISYWLLVIGKKSSVLGLRSLVLFFTLLGLAGLYFSFAPTIEIFGLTVKTPAYYIFPHLPVFRVYARFGLLVILAVSILAGIGLSFLLEKIKSQKVSLFLCSLVSLLLLIEFLNFPPFHYTDVSEKAMPQVYQWLKNQPKGVVAEYPLFPTDEPESYAYLLWQRYHKMPLVYGAPVNSEGDRFRKTILNPGDPSVIDKLKQIGVDYLVLHKNDYSMGNVQKHPAECNGGRIPQISNTDLEFLKVFDQSFVYKIK